jgi:hypothetical protein
VSQPALAPAPFRVAALVEARRIVESAGLGYVVVGQLVDRAVDMDEIDMLRPVHRPPPHLPIVVDLVQDEVVWPVAGLDEDRYTRHGTGSPAGPSSANRRRARNGLS